MVDRAVDQQLMMVLLEMSTVPSGAGAKSWHQAKFRCSLKVASSNEWALLWRPTLHCVGVLVEGVMEVYYIMDPDMTKDNNLELTLLSGAQDRTWARLSLTYNSTAWAGTNQHMVTWMDWLLASMKFSLAQHVGPVVLSGGGVAQEAMSAPEPLGFPDGHPAVCASGGNPMLVAGKLEAV
jgi:hypothetical protein